MTCTEAIYVEALLGPPRRRSPETALYGGRRCAWVPDAGRTCPVVAVDSLLGLPQGVLEHDCVIVPPIGRWALLGRQPGPVEHLDPETLQPRGTSCARRWLSGVVPDRRLLLLDAHGLGEEALRQSPDYVDIPWRIPA